MDLQLLRTLIAVSENPNFAEAGRSLGLSHSCVSLHIRTLEEQMKIKLVNRQRRGPTLTERGVEVVYFAHQALDSLEGMRRWKSGIPLSETLTIGASPSTATHLLPKVLADMRSAHPQLVIKVRIGLSDVLIRQLRNREIDAAVSTKPPTPLAGLESREICREPLLVLAPRHVREERDADILAGNPFIWFNRKTHDGQRIETILHNRNIQVTECMEAESFDMIETMVCAGMGVAVVPLRPYAPDFTPLARVIPLADPNAHRTLAQIERSGNPCRRQTDELFERLTLHAGGRKNHGREHAAQNPVKRGIGAVSN